MVAPRAWAERRSSENRINALPSAPAADFGTAIFHCSLGFGCLSVAIPLGEGSPATALTIGLDRTSQTGVPFVEGHRNASVIFYMLVMGVYKHDRTQLLG